jgi:3-oxoacyl-[acyl-carrier-protein] synthase-1
VSAIAITGIGAVSPVGLTAASTAAALRAGVARLGPVASSEVDVADGEVAPATGGRVPLEWLRGGPVIEEWPGHDRAGVPPPLPAHLFIEDGAARLAALAAPAVEEAWAATSSPTPPPADFGLFLGLDEADVPEPVAAAVLAALPGWRPRALEAVRAGRASALAALHRAREEIAARRIAGAIVGGVDSLIRPSVYERLTNAGVVKDEEHPHGVHPGEAAAFLVVEARPRGPVLARLLGTGRAEEPTAGTDKPNQAVGLCGAIRAARKASPELADRPFSICDLNGDRYHALEWMLALIRALGDLRWKDAPPLDEFWHPADCTGDTGAASGALCCVWAVEAFRKRYAGAGKALVWGASDGRLRAAAVLAP